ncbi:MAG: metallophosphoesterase [Deltaproteobacteria bacterium]|nr:metallophosphoesterase [Deltaproteobacteria bacterium]
MRIAHFSDLHLLSLEGVPLKRFMNKRITGWAMLRLHRRSVHKPHAVRAVADEVKRAQIDHVTITGDLTNLALETEFELVRRFIEEDLGMHPEQVSVVPGNHDVYTRGSAEKRRFELYCGDWIASDLPEFGVEHFGAKYPFVKLRGPVAVIGMSTAVPRSPLMAAGQFGSAQLDQLHKILHHPEVEKRTKVVLQHHPAHNLKNKVLAYLEGLHDSRHMIKKLARVEHGLILHGHSHIRVRRTIDTDVGRIDVVGATSASLLSEHPHRHAGFNLYEFDDDTGRLMTVEAHVLEEDGTFRREDIPVDASSVRERHDSRTSIA